MKKIKKIFIIPFIIILTLLYIHNVNVLAIETNENQMTVDISYEYNEDNSSVTVKAISNKELVQKRLEGWILGQDKKSYTAIYYENQTFKTFFTDTDGNKIEKEVKIDKINESGAPTVEIEYHRNIEKNTVVVEAKSNRKLIQKRLAGWVLGQDKMSYTAEYDKNQTFKTFFTDIFGNKVEKEIVITQIDDKGPVVNVTYSANEEKDQVIVTARANEKLKRKTLSGWVLGEDQMSYTAVYTENQTFNTYFTDIYGNKTEKQIVINQIDENLNPKINITYKYNNTKNTVTVKAISNRKLIQKRLAGWILGEDKKTYTAEYTTNQTFNTNFTDVYGNKTEKQIIINQIDDEAPVVEISYDYDETTNKVIVTAIANEKLRKKNLEGWVLGQDKKSYTAVYTKNQTFNTYFTDIYGNKTEKHIVINQIDDRGPVVNVSYLPNKETNKVTVIVTSDEVMVQKTLSGWILSDDKKTYTALYDKNQKFVTNFTDIYGNKTPTEINIVDIDDKGPEVRIEYKYNDDNTVTVHLKSNEKMDDTKSEQWILSKDQMTYSKTFSSSQDYDTIVKDVYGNSTTVHLRVVFRRSEYKSADNSKVAVKYLYTSYDNVIVEITSSEKLKSIKTSGWTLSSDGYTYTKTFVKNTDYTEQIENINGYKKDISIDVDQLPEEIIIEQGTYGKSGALINGLSSGSELKYYRFGQGPNVLFTTFAVHGYEDSWDKDGLVLTNIANDFYNRLISEMDRKIARNWTIYIFPQVNPDGINLGYTNNGPGRTTIYSKLGKGMDINRCWQTDSDYKIYTDDRNYNGIEGFQAYEAEYLRNFLLSHKSTTGRTVLIDLHGWEDQLIGDECVCKYYKQQFTSAATSGYGRYGTQYLITWGRQNLGADVSLVELPLAKNYDEVNSMNLSSKYVDATLNLLRGI